MDYFDKWMSCVTPVNKQAAISVSCSNEVQRKVRANWVEHKELMAKVSAGDARRKLAKAMFAWAAEQDRWYCKGSALAAISEHFNLRFSLCRLIVNEWERQGKMVCTSRGVVFSPIKSRSSSR